MFRSTVTSDVEAQAEEVAGWSQQYHQLTAGAFHGRVDYIELPGLQLFFETFNRRVHQASSLPPGCIAFSQLLDAVEEGWLCGAPFGPCNVALLRSGNEMHFRTPRESTVVTVVIDADRMLRLADDLGIRASFERMLISGVVTIPPVACHDLVEEARRIRTMAHLAAPRLSTDEGRRTVSEDLLGRWMSALFVGDAEVTCQLPRNRRLRQRIVSDAYRYISENAACSPTVLEVCREIRVHQRVLEHCFKEAFGLTPVSYLRHLRLHHVRRRLRETSGPAPIIGEVAAAFGFWHLGRFSADYKRLFAELPSETTRRRVNPWL